MKKTIILIAGILAIGLFLFFGCGIKQYIPEIPSRLAKYHNTGNVTITVDGEKVNLNGVELLYKNDLGENIETVKLNDSGFKFKDGQYGVNTFSLKVPCDILNEIAVEFGQFNTNWWHVCRYDVNVEITTNEDKTATAKMNTSIIVEDYETKYEQVKTLTFDDNTIVCGSLQGYIKEHTK